MRAAAAGPPRYGAFKLAVFCLLVAFATIEMNLLSGVKAGAPQLPPAAGQE